MKIFKQSKSSTFRKQTFVIFSAVNYASHTVLDYDIYSTSIHLNDFFTDIISHILYPQLDNNL